MRLLKVDSPELELVEFFGDRIPEYAILSHTWGDDEVLYQDLQIGNYRQKLGYKKILFACHQARKDDLHWCWVDTCCIDKSSSAELSEAINSMFNWYKKARVCYTYLADVHRSGPSYVNEGKFLKGDIAGTDVDLIGDQHKRDVSFEARAGPTGHEPINYNPAITERADTLAFGKLNKAIHDSRWFDRGWTLQELIAPRLLRFYDHSWCYLGDRDNELLQLVCDRTSLTPTTLGSPVMLEEIPIARRMSWMARRQTTRKEDIAYCLLGIFGVNMPLLYGEEEKAFTRLQEEIAKRSGDHSLFVFSDPVQDSLSMRPILAASPREFAHCNNLEPCDMLKDTFGTEPYHLTSDGLHISLPLLQFEDSGSRIELAVLNYQIGGSPIGLNLGQFTYNSGVDLRFISSTQGVIMQGMVKSLRLGKGIVSIPKEIAITAQKAMVVIRGIEHIGPFFHPPVTQIWLRYDSALQYELASPGCVAPDTVAKQRDWRPPHMICINTVTAASSGAILRFSVTDSPGRQTPSVIVAFTDKTLETSAKDGTGARGALLGGETPHSETEDQLQILGTSLLDNINHETDDCRCSQRKIASTNLEGRRMLELWCKVGFTSGLTDHCLLTLRIRRPKSPTQRKIFFCDGQQDCYDSSDESFSE
jgi:hypothetical protein